MKEIHEEHFDRLVDSMAERYSAEQLLNMRLMHTVLCWVGVPRAHIQPLILSALVSKLLRDRRVSELEQLRIIH